MKRKFITLAISLAASVGTANAVDFIVGGGVGNTSLKLDGTSMGSDTNKHLFLELAGEKYSVRLSRSDLGSFKEFDTTLHTLDLLRAWKVVENGQVFANVGVAVFNLDYKSGWVTDSKGKPVLSSTGQPIKRSENEVSGGVVYGLGYRHTISKVLLQASYSQAQGGSDFKPSAGSLNFSLGYRF